MSDLQIAHDDAALSGHHDHFFSSGCNHRFCRDIFILSEKEKNALMAAIKESNARRVKILATILLDSKDKVSTLLKAEREALIAKMNSYLTKEQIAGTLELMKRKTDRKGTGLTKG